MKLQKDVVAHVLYLLDTARIFKRHGSNQSSNSHGLPSSFQDTLTHPRCRWRHRSLIWVREATRCQIEFLREIS